jgi:hypothetical protein
MISYTFSVGYGCSTDDFLKFVNLRKYSGPFSYMLCDLKSSLNFIDSDFEEFTNIADISHITITRYNKPWNNTKVDKLYSNINHIPKQDNIKLDELSKVCWWNHHDMSLIEEKESLNRKIQRMNNSTKNHDKNTLLVYIGDQGERLITNYKNAIDFDDCIKFVEKRKNIYLCLMLPVLDFSNVPEIIKIHTNINLILFRITDNGNILLFREPGKNNGPHDIQWDIIKEMFLNLYSFHIIQTPFEEQCA